MSLILENSKIFRGSKNKQKILAASMNPINQPLMKQLESYIPEELVVEDNNKFEDKSSEIEIRKEESEETKRDDTKDSKEVRKQSAHSAPKPHHTPKVDSKQDNEFIDENVQEAQSEVTDDVVEEIEEVTNSTDVKSQAIQAGTYVTIETVSQAVNEIPGMLNLYDETKGATQAILKGGADNELWVYYKSGVDISDVVEHVNTRLASTGYYFLSFNRMNRDNNAIIFTVNWVSSYFNPMSMKKGEDES